MNEIRYPSLGETWLAVLREVYRSGRTVGAETRELLGVVAAFEQGDIQEPLLLRFANRQDIEEMRKVYFSAAPNQFGHSYADKVRGPLGRRDLSDVAELLAREPWSKRAVVTLGGCGDGRVPCINVVQFLRRDGGLLAAYFARGQDIFRKFPADALCIYEMAQRVAARLDIPVILVSGFISSAHIYLADLPAIRTLLTEAEAYCAPGSRLA